MNPEHILRLLWWLHQRPRPSTDSANWSVQNFPNVGPQGARVESPQTWGGDLRGGHGGGRMLLP